MSLDPENIESAKLWDVTAIKAAWAEWFAASAETERLRLAYKGSMHYGKPRGLVADHYSAWLATLDRTDAARKAVAGLPDLDEVAAYETEQAEIAEEANRQGDLL